MDQKIRARLSNFAKGLQGPLGTVPFDRAIRTDLGLFSTLRNSGATWIQIANALASAGARRQNGGVISADHIRSAISRQLKRCITLAEAPDGSQAAAEPHEKATPRSARKPSAQPKANIAPPMRKQSAGSSTNTKATPKMPTDRNTSVMEKLARTRQLRES